MDKKPAQHDTKAKHLMPSFNVPLEGSTDSFTFDGPVYDGKHSAGIRAIKNAGGQWYFKERWPGEPLTDGCLPHDQFIEKLNTMKIPHTLSKGELP